MRAIPIVLLRLASSIKGFVREDANYIVTPIAVDGRI